MSMTKLLGAGARASDRAVVVSGLRRCVRIGLSSRLSIVSLVSIGKRRELPARLPLALSSARSMGLHLCVLVGAALGGNAAHAAIPSLPPLPDYMPSDESALTFDAPYQATPLPRAAIAETPNPFRDDSLDDAATSRRSTAPAPDPDPTPVADSRTDDATDPSDGSVPLARQAGAPRRDAAASASALEGPPVPLPPLTRLSGTPKIPADATLAADDKPISLNFQRAELGAVLNAFAQFTGLNIVASERVRGSVSLRLDKVPWRVAFDTLLDVHGLAMERHGNVVWVAPIADLAARERQRFEAHARAADLEPLASRTFQLHYARAEDVRRLLTGSGNQRVLSKRGAVTADPRTNLLFVTDLEGRLAQIAALLDSVDRPTRQVLIEARIVEGEHGFSRNLGVRLSMAGTSADGSTRGLSGGKDGLVYDLSARPIAGFDAATAGLTLFAAGATRLLNIELSALEAEGRGQVVSSPRVVTADRMKAVVEQGTELPYQAKVGQGVSGVQFRRATLKLEVEPQIMPDGRVVLDLDVAKDSVGEQTDAGPAINTKHVQTRVEVEDGGTVSIGGIYATDGRDDVTRVPVLGKIPILGALFRHRAHRDQRSELAVFITPRVVQTN
ncbi:MULTISPECIES: type IV pilus secretin PilQ [Paraburkholderia]|uniref:type IV pilus secretin PilQ n=1 Tax=Paraburkholderia phenoliruptrix TaxID=252970 RepID=UPI001C6E6503|nr:type IV pilus secretin PilQ [Paraburkholderia phenoliruptrix]MBW9131594.1 type IV pilus secretin PilQ [Paraburkholderia ginsengiterrae]